MRVRTTTHRAGTASQSRVVKEPGAVAPHMRRSLASCFMKCLDGGGGGGGGITAISWNIAAINSNPFEYWLTHPDEDYAKLMASVEKFILEPAEQDVRVGDVFTDEMWSELKALMEKEGWPGVAETESMWKDDLSQRRIISGFMKDKTIGDKRLASMPDRVTNAIGTMDGSVAYRPTVISNYAGEMRSLAAWWDAWCGFMFKTPLQVEVKGKVLSTAPCGLLGKIRHSKYPAISEAEEAISIPLQTLSMAVFDSILLHLVSLASPDGKWQALKQEIVNTLLLQKDARVVDVLERSYADADCVFLQEATARFADYAESRLADRYFLVRPAQMSANNQNSLLLLRNSLFDKNSVSELTSHAMSSLESQPVAAGDLLLIAVSANSTQGTPDTGAAGTIRGATAPRHFLIASFHGDTNGLATPAVLSAVDSVAKQQPLSTFLFGLDANTHSAGSKKQQGFAEFVKMFDEMGYSSCWGDDAGAGKLYTTFNARTFLQPQLQKAVRASEVHAGVSALVDKNPKDFILFRSTEFVSLHTTRDNTGGGSFVEDMVFPTVDFPSDHAVIKTQLVPCS